ncbi:MAG TPA: hypothetical protein VKA10_01960 [Prolixibacteraceae bacterium]|nr:hypothetical protein [Prolixibacteraceae bacterium]
MKISSRMRFLFRNGLKGLAWFVVLIGGYWLFRKAIFAQNPEYWLEQFYAQPQIIYLIYTASEIFFGIIPPELFMIWAVNKSDAIHYFWNIAFFAGVSYAAGYLTFLLGQFLYKRVTFRYIRIRFFKGLWPKLKKYGIFLIIVAALTPLPWSAVSMLIGASGYPAPRFLRYALFRILRFAVYGFIVYQTHQI